MTQAEFTQMLNAAIQSGDATELTAALQAAQMTQEEFDEMLAVAIAQGIGGGTYISQYSGEEIDTLLGLTGYAAGSQVIANLMTDIQAAQEAAEAAAEAAAGDAQDASDAATAAAGDAQDAQGAAAEAKAWAEAAGQVAVPDGSITAQKLADGAVTTPKLADGAVTTVKLATGSVTDAILASAAVTNPKIADGAVGYSKLGADVKTIISNRGPLPSDVGTPGQRWLDTAHGNVEYTCIAVTVGTPNTYTWLYTGGCNENMLDNAYFVGGGAPGSFPINQRQGWVVPGGVTYYSDTGLTTSAGTTSGYVTATYVNTTYGTITVSGTTYYVAYGDMVRGYVNVGTEYTIDRYLIPSFIVLTIEDCLKIKAIASNNARLVRQPFLAKDFAGCTLTMSMLVKSSLNTRVQCALYGGNNSANLAVTYATTSTSQEGTGENFLISCTGTIPDNPTYPYVSATFGFVNYQPIGSEAEIVAIKLELGSTQTLAHQDENGNWVPNEVPNFQQELAKCQDYLLDFVGFPSTTPGEIIGVGFCRNNNLARIMVPTPVTFKTLPAVEAVNMYMAYTKSDGTYSESTACTVQSAKWSPQPNSVMVDFVVSDAKPGSIALLRNAGHAGSVFRLTREP